MKEVLARREAYNKLEAKRARKRDKIFKDIRKLGCTVCQTTQGDGYHQLADTNLPDHDFYS